MRTTILCALLLLQPLAAGWTATVGDGCYHWPPKEDPSLCWCRCPKEPDREDVQGCREPCHPPNGGSRGGSPLQHQRCPRVAPLQASFTTPPGTTLPATDKPVPDWAAFCLFIAILVSITLGLVACHCKERYWGRWRARCCTHVFLSESPDSTPQMEGLSSSLLIPLPFTMTPYIGNLMHRGVGADDLQENQEGPPVIHLALVGAENPEDKAIGGSVGSRTVSGYALKPRPLPDHILEPRPPLENALEPRLSPDHALEPRPSPDPVLEPRPSPDHALEPRPSPDRAPGLILKTEPISTPATPGEEKL